MSPSHFRGLLMDLSATTLSGSILQEKLDAFHSFGDAADGPQPREVRVRCRPANTAPRAALLELKKQGFAPITALEFSAPSDQESREDAWTLLGVYARELHGWALTARFSFSEAAERLGNDEGILHAPVGGKSKSVLLSATALRLLS